MRRGAAVIEKGVLTTGAVARLCLGDRLYSTGGNISMVSCADGRRRERHCWSMTIWRPPPRPRRGCRSFYISFFLKFQERSYEIENGWMQQRIDLEIYGTLGRCLRIYKGSTLRIRWFRVLSGKRENCTGRIVWPTISHAVRWYGGVTLFGQEFESSLISVWS